MKKLVLTLAIVFAGIMSANAQVWAGGSTSLAIAKGYNAFSIAPEVGYMIPNTDFTVAAGVSYKHDNAGTNELVLSPYFRYAPLTIADKFVLFLDLTADVGLLDHKGAFSIGLQPGIAWMATEKWTAAFRFAFAEYDHGLDIHDQGHVANGFYLNCALVAPSFGLYYNF